MKIMNAVFIVILINLIATTPDSSSTYSPISLDQRIDQIIAKQTKDIQDLKNENKELKGQIEELRSEIRDERTDIKTVNSVIMFYSKAGTLNKWYWINPNMVNRIVKYIRKWKHLAGEIPYVSEFFDFELYSLAWAIQETNLNPSALNTNTNKTRDYGIMQINDCNMHLLNQLPEELKKDIMDLETNIAVFMLWNKDRRKYRMPWLTIKEDQGWKPYRIIRSAKYGN